MIQSTLLAALEAAFQTAVTAEVESQLTGIRQHFANTVGELAAKVASLEHAVEMKELDYATLAESLSDDQIRRIGRQAGERIDWASAVDWSEALDYSEIASAIDLEELAGEFDLSSIAEEIDIQKSVHEFFANNQVTISV